LKRIQELIEEAVAYIAQNDWVSYVQLEQLLTRHGIQTKGDIAIHMVDRPNTILWAGMTQECADFFMTLQRDVRIGLSSGSSLSYFVDGKILTLPVPKRVNPKNDFAKPYWIPTFFRIAKDAEI
jgi:hypothetical protein